MVTRSYMSRREVEQQSFSLMVALLVPLGAVLLQVLLPKALPRLAILDLPLIVTLFFAISRRNPIAGTITGATIGLLQDVLTIGFSLVQSVLLYLIERHLLGVRAFHVLWLHELLRAVVNTGVGVPIYLLLDRLKYQE